MGFPFLLALALDGLTLLAICNLYQNNGYLFTAVAAIFLVVVFVRAHRRRLMIVVLALLVGTVGEYICCRVNLWIYHNPSYGGLPIWLPMIWPILMISFGDVAQSVCTALARWFSQKSLKWIERLLLVLIIAYALCCFWLIKPVIAAIFFVFLSAMLIYARSLFSRVFFVIAAVGGTLGEVICMRFGVWHYTSPLLGSIGVPLSLPLAWGLSANLIYLLVDYCLRLADKDKVL